MIERLNSAKWIIYLESTYIGTHLYNYIDKKQREENTPFATGTQANSARPARQVTTCTDFVSIAGRLKKSTSHRADLRSNVGRVLNHLQGFRIYIAVHVRLLDLTNRQEITGNSEMMAASDSNWVRAQQEQVTSKRVITSRTIEWVQERNIFWTVDKALRSPIINTQVWNIWNKYWLRDNIHVTLLFFHFFSYPVINSRHLVRL